MIDATRSVNKLEETITAARDIVGDAGRYTGDARFFPRRPLSNTDERFECLADVVGANRTARSGSIAILGQGAVISSA